MADALTAAELTDSLQDAQPGLFACYQAAAAGIGISGERAGKSLMRLMVSPGAGTAKPTVADPPEQPIATALGVNLYAKQLVDPERFAHKPASAAQLEWAFDGGNPEAPARSCRSR